MTSPRKAKGTRLDHKASPSTTTAKGSAGDTAVGGILIELGWAQIADLARTFPGADLIAFCGRDCKHEFWGEVKTYPIGKIAPGSWEHIQDRALETLSRPRTDFALFTYQRLIGRPKGGASKQWFVARYPDWAENQQPLISVRRSLLPPCASGSTLVSAPPHAEG